MYIYKLKKQKNKTKQNKKSLGKDRWIIDCHIESSRR